MLKNISVDLDIHFHRCRLILQLKVKDLGLDRGIEGSKAKHTSIREYYNDVNNYEPEPNIVNT
jgi:hypothetical protein